MNKRILMFIVFCMIFLLGSVIMMQTKGEEESERKTMKYTKISADEAAEKMNGDVIVLDVRAQEEFAEGHIENAMLLQHDTITEDTATKLLPDKAKEILVYCRTGRRSEIASKKLLELGYETVYDFGGITTDWNGEIVK